MILLKQAATKECSEHNYKPDITCFEDNVSDIEKKNRIKTK